MQQVGFVLPAAHAWHTTGPLAGCSLVDVIYWMCLQAAGTRLVAHGAIMDCRLLLGMW
jgi:hypothetical protein